MKQKQHTAEEIIRILRQAETEDIGEAVCRTHNISKATFLRKIQRDGLGRRQTAQSVGKRKCRIKEALLHKSAGLG